MDNDLKEYISPAELDALLVRLRCGVDTVDAVHVAMTEGHCGADSYTDALFGAIEGLYATAGPAACRGAHFLGADRRVDLRLGRTPQNTARAARPADPDGA